MRLGQACRISSAALLVKVMARISHGVASPVAMRWAMRWVRTLRLARAGAGHHQQRPAAVDHGPALGLVEPLEQLVGVYGQALPPGPRAPARRVADFAARASRVDATRAMCGLASGRSPLRLEARRTVALEGTRPTETGKGRGRGSAPTVLTPTRWCRAAST